MRTVVTGANGFIGVHTVRALLQAGYDVLAIDVDNDRLREFEGSKRFEMVLIDVFDEALDALFEKGDKVLHLAAIARFDLADANPQQAIRVNIGGTVNIIKGCMKKKVDRLVYSSTGSVYSPNATVPIREDAPREPNSVYGMTKKQAEDWIFFFADRLPYVILRYAYIYGRGKDWGAVGAFLKNIREGKRPVVFGGKQTNDFVCINDVVRANLLALETERTSQVYNIGTGRATSIKDVCELCLKASKSNLTMEVKPAREFEILVFVYDISKAESLLKYTPQWNIYDGLEDLLKQE